MIADYQGTLADRMELLEEQCRPYDELILVGSSFGGLMAVNFAIHHPDKCKKMILLAPALNFDGFVLPQNPLIIPTVIIIGEHDTVTPPSIVLPLIKKCFTHPEIRICADDHLLADVFQALDWPRYLSF